MLLAPHPAPQALEREPEGAVGRLAQELGRGGPSRGTEENSHHSLELDLGIKVQQWRISGKQFSVQPASREPGTA